jgi:quercetin dioxygenase-like cupin family protein
MNTMNRRDLCVALSSFAALAAVAAEGQAQEAGSLPETMAVPPPPGSAGDKVLTTPMSFRFDDLPVVKTGNGETRAVIRGVLPTGEAVELHETTLLPGHMPHPPHKHRHSEFMLVREGQMEFENNGTPERLGPGGVMFAASNVMHGLKNVGPAMANYFVLAIGRESEAETV